MITKKDIEHIALLARIKLTEKEEEKLAKDFGLILGYIDKLKEVKTNEVSGAELSKWPHEVFRKDKAGDSDLISNPQELLSQTPDRKEDYIKVRAVFEGSNDE